MGDLKPGQKYPTPTRGYGDRVFYETLLRQNPNSSMAAEWCVSYGVLSKGEAAKLYKIMLKKKKDGKSSLSPVREMKNKKRRIAKDEAIIDDVGMDVGGSEMVGSATL
mmetsp:Transcript_5509/g.8223  ORF Transcript_5509/g.8223 Transcript_5509/m.8223 type:complete len:108 (+) Transcript_5509:120-443(+)|eukprot:CAMPEP_0197247908 /NCGR_PEP_ID=MMETSP1429-20130617/32558_1 /TAXON_ID=49237 /ORGANISM="Chaetoceros  sp., Strain UNC1202" /LENGTH=107 /DNA_ID=CAMNT_0042708957 /DNA_START=151 /DNA_END=474 /DNA_ORIENTATION=-